LLLDEFPDARLVLSGAGDPEWALPTGPQSAAVRDAIDVVGPGDPDEVPARYREATLTVLPAEHEAFGLALVESLACGTPAVCTPQGGMPEILDDPAVGRVAAAATPEALAEAMRQVLAMSGDSGLPGRCVAQARRFSWEDAVGPAHEAQYRALCRR
jgi:glycosyltransferase involved in cell wall biosynthesis